MATLTMEQQQALDGLFRTPSTAAATAKVVTTGAVVSGQPARGVRNEASRMPDLLQSWLGLSQADLGARLTGLLADKASLERQILAWAEANPLEAAVELLAASSLAFYLVEKGANPKINSYVDAFYYIATCASVGYADIFAVTQPGRAVAALVMTVGPALAARLFDRPTK